MNLKSEEELIEHKLAYVRNHIFDESDFVSDDGCDLTASYVGSPYEVLCGMEQKILRQQINKEKTINELENRINDARNRGEINEAYVLISFLEWLRQTNE